MSEQGIDAYRVASVLGYCLLPMVGVGAISVMVTLEFVSCFFAFAFCLISILVEHLAIFFPLCLFYGAHMLLPAFSWPSFACPISVYSSHIQLAYCTDVSPY